MVKTIDALYGAPKLEIRSHTLRQPVFFLSYLTCNQQPQQPHWLRSLFKDMSTDLTITIVSPFENKTDVPTHLHDISSTITYSWSLC